MKILHVITGLRIGGAESALYNFLLAAISQHRAKHAVAYFHHGVNVEKIQRLGIPVFKVSGFLFTYSPWVFFNLKKIVKSFQPDILHTSLWSANIIGRLFSMWQPISLICDLHGNSFDEGVFRNWFDRLTVTIPHKLVAVGDSVASAYKKNIIDMACLPMIRGAKKSTWTTKDLVNKLVVIKNGINIALLNDNMQRSSLTRANLGINDKAFVIGTIGRMEPIKSYDILIKAFARFLQIKNGDFPIILCLVGDGSQRRALEVLIQKLGITDKVVLLGFRDDCYALYRLFDCFALSSQSEGISIALLEAMATGLPIITTHYEQRHDVITNGVHGLLVPVNDCEKYAQALNYLYVHQEVRQQMRQDNQTLMASSFNILTVVDRYYEIYRQVLSFR